MQIFFYIALPLSLLRFYLFILSFCNHIVCMNINPVAFEATPTRMRCPDWGEEQSGYRSRERAEAQGRTLRPVHQEARRGHRLAGGADGRGSQVNCFLKLRKYTLDIIIWALLLTDKCGRQCVRSSTKWSARTSSSAPSCSPDTEPNGRAQCPRGVRRSSSIWSTCWSEWRTMRTSCTSCACRTPRSTTPRRSASRTKFRYVLLSCVRLNSSLRDSTV